MLKGLKVRKPQEKELDEPPLQKKNKGDKEKVIDLHRERIKEKGRRFEDSSEEEEQDKPKTRAQKYKENQKKGEIIYQQKLSTKALANCYYCLQNEKISENIILSNGNHAMLLIPQLQIYKDYWHFYIVPIEHALAIRDLEDGTYEEVRNYMKCLVSAFDKVDMEVVFYENAFNFKVLPHAIMECVVIPNKIAKEANLNVYFKQGMDELDGFWVQHKRIIEISKSKGGIRKQIPKGFPYFYVDFGLQSGYAHVIENEDRYSANFAREILATILKIDKNCVISPKYRDEDSFPKLKEEFQKIWKMYDWTTMLRVS